MIAGVGAVLVFVSSISSGQDALHDMIGKEKTKNLKNILLKEFTPLSAMSFMIFVLLYFPCIVVIAVVRVEFGSWKWAGFIVFYQILLAWIVFFLYIRLVF